MGQQSFEELHHDLQNFDDYFDYAAFSGASMDDGGISSTAPMISIAHAASSSGDFSVPRSMRTEDIYLQSSDETRVQGLSTQLNNNDGSEVMEGVFSHFGSSFHPSWDSETPGHSFLSYMDWETSPNYNFDQDLLVDNLHSNKYSRIADTTSNLDHPRPTEFSHHRSWIAEERSAPVNPPQDFLGQEVMTQRVALDSLIEAQDVPRNAETLPSAGQINMGAFQISNIPAPVTGSQFPVVLGTCPDSFGEFRPNPGQGFHGPNLNADLYRNHSNTALLGQNYPWSSNDADPVATCCNETSLVRMKEFVQTPQAGYGFSGRGKNRIRSSAVPESGCSRLRKNLPILPAPAKSSPTEARDAKSLTILQTVFDPQEALPSRSDRRKLTANGKKNAREVRGHSCIVCVMKNQRCDTKEICDNCQKMVLAKNPKLAIKHICIRDGILDFRQRIEDFYDRKSRLSLIQEVPCGPLRRIIIGEYTNINGAMHPVFPRRVPLTVEIREFDTPYSSVINISMIQSVETKSPAISSYAIEHTKLPSAKQLDELRRNWLLEFSEIPLFRPNIMDIFLFSYLNFKSKLQYHELVELTISLVSLSTWLFQEHPTKFVGNVENFDNLSFSIFDTPDMIEERMSPVARLQFMLIAAEAFETKEQKIFSIMDKSMRPHGCSPQDALILGLCIRRISLLYRSFFKRYKKFALNSTISLRIQKSLAMYEALSTAYSLVYRGAKSPFSKKWSLDDHLGAFGNNRKLSDLFLEVVEYDREVCENNRDDEDDALLNKIFLERREGGGPRK